MKPETRLALLEAFAASKSYEFNGFAFRWLEAHPELAEAQEAEKKPLEEVVVKVAEVAETEVAVESEPEVATEKPKPKRKA